MLFFFDSNRLTWKTRGIVAMITWKSMMEAIVPRRSLEKYVGRNRKCPRAYLCPAEIGCLSSSERI